MAHAPKKEHADSEKPRETQLLFLKALSIFSRDGLFLFCPWIFLTFRMIASSNSQSIVTASRDRTLTPHTQTPGTISDDSHDLPTIFDDLSDDSHDLATIQHDIPRFSRSKTPATYKRLETPEYYIAKLNAETLLKKRLSPSSF